MGRTCNSLSSCMSHYKAWHTNPQHITFIIQEFITRLYGILFGIKFDSKLTNTAVRYCCWPRPCSSPSHGALCAEIFGSSGSVIPTLAVLTGSITNWFGAISTQFCNTEDKVNIRQMLPEQTYFFQNVNVLVQHRFFYLEAKAHCQGSNWLCRLPWKKQLPCHELKTIKVVQFYCKGQIRPHFIVFG